jgi:hypothetical protein
MHISNLSILACIGTFVEAVGQGCVICGRCGACQCGTKSNIFNLTLGLKIMSFHVWRAQNILLSVHLFTYVENGPSFLILNLNFTNSYVNFELTHLTRLHLPSLCICHRLRFHQTSRHPSESDSPSCLLSNLLSLLSSSSLYSSLSCFSASSMIVS